MSYIQGKTALVTGGANGIGSKLVEDLLRHGAKGVAVLDLAASPGESVVATLEKEFGKGRAVFFPCDVTDDEQFTAAFKQAVKALGGLDIMVNNAGMMNDLLWERTISVNTTGLIRGSLLAMNHMSKHNGGNGGTILNVASIVGLHPIKCVPVYSATKHAVVGFSRSIQDCYEATGVRIVVMCPGLTETRIIADMESKIFDFIDLSRTNEDFKDTSRQSVDVVSKAMIGLIEKGKNGDVWISERGEPPYAVEIPHYKKLSVHA